MIRFQGTDGVRRPVRLSSDPSLTGLTPQEAFIERGVLTEEFMELYAFCRVRQLVESGAMNEGEAFVIGWDPRDPEGTYTSAAARGLARAGARVAAAGVVPTPCVALYMQHIGAAGALVITASHNPAAYNGIKIFTRRGLKLLPPDDVALSAIVMETDYRADVANRPVTGTIDDHHGRAVDLFARYSLDPANSWIEDPAKLAGITLIVDASNGAVSTVANRVFGAAGFGRLIIVNGRRDGSVNVRCGVAELDGVHEITAGQVESGGRLARNEAAVRLFEEGRAQADAIRAGEAYVTAAVFDGDADRFCRVDFNPYDDTAFVLTGDEIGLLQAEYMKDRGADKLFVATVESDLSAAGAAARWGYETELTAVGDKWILLLATLAFIRRAAPETVRRRMESLAAAGSLSADAIETALDDAGFSFAEPDTPDFVLVGGEESGHTITPGVLTAADGRRLAVFHGNGVKSCLNTFAATCQGPVSRIEAVAERLAKTRKPFEAGFKKTLYAYYVDKTKWRRGSAVWREAETKLREAMRAAWPGAEVEEMIRGDETDMLYLKVIIDGAHAASAFIRNSGTEDKTGLSLRGPADESETLLAVGEKGLRLLMRSLKDRAGVMGNAERELLRTAAQGGAPRKPVAGLDEKTYDRLLTETGSRQGLLDGAHPGALLTDRGKWYRSQIADD